MKKIEKTDILKKVLGGRSFTVDVFQREYRWGSKHIEDMLSDFQNCFENEYDPEKHDSLKAVANFGFYFMGQITCVDGTELSIVDGQQRLTSLTLLLIYLVHLQEELDMKPRINLRDYIYSDQYGEMQFNINVPERADCMRALMKNDTSFKTDNESCLNMIARYQQIVDEFPEELKGDALPFFIYWLIEKVLFLELDTDSEEEAYTIFLTMNDRGLSLNSAEMLKAFVMQQIKNRSLTSINKQWQANINRIKAASDIDTSGSLNTQDVDFISTWLRAKYATTLRESKVNAKDEDYELLGEKFHTWVRANARGKMGLIKSDDYANFVTKEMTMVTELYLRIKSYEKAMTPGFEEVFYNANRDLNYQTMLIISAVCTDDPDDIVVRKIQMISKFVDDWASIRIFNFKKVNWNSNKNLLFRVMKDIRNKDCRTIGMVLVRTLRRMDATLDGITKFNLNQFSARYMLHLLARFTSYVNVQMGNPSEFDIYVDRKRKGNTYDIEHILPDDFASYSDLFENVDEFRNQRQRLGNLIILTRDKNRSYQDMTYQVKVQRYAGDNVLAKALNENAYENNPKFKPLVDKYGFHAMMEKFDRESIDERENIYLQMAADIWDPDDIKELAGGWEDEEKQDYFRSDKASEFTVEYWKRSWPDAHKYGFLSANMKNTGRYLRNIQVGDIIYCHIAGAGFVGIGECTALAVPMDRFTVTVDGEEKLIGDVPWIREDLKDTLITNEELFIRVDWKRAVDDEKDGYWVKGMKSLPMVAYQNSDRTTHDMVQKYFESL